MTGGARDVRARQRAPVENQFSDGLVGLVDRGVGSPATQGKHSTRAPSRCSAVTNFSAVSDRIIGSPLERDADTACQGWGRSSQMPEGLTPDGLSEARGKAPEVYQ